MPRLTDSFDVDGDGDIDYNDFRSAVSRSWDNFTEFAMRDNVLEVAVGLMHGNPIDFSGSHS